MKKFIITYVIVACAILSGFSQTETLFHNKLSPGTISFLAEFTQFQGKVSLSTARKYNLIMINGVYYAGALVMVDLSTIQNAINQWNVIIGTKAGKVRKVKTI